MSTLLDETCKVAVTRFGRRIRVGDIAELSGFDLSLREGARKTLLMVTEDLFPGASEMARGEFWTGLRPMTTVHRWSVRGRCRACSSTPVMARWAGRWPPAGAG